MTFLSAFRTGFKNVTAGNRRRVVAIAEQYLQTRTPIPVMPQFVNQLG